MGEGNKVKQKNPAKRDFFVFEFVLEYDCHETS